MALSVLTKVIVLSIDWFRFACKFGHLLKVKKFLSKINKNRQQTTNKLKAIESIARAAINKGK